MSNIKITSKNKLIQKLNEIRTRLPRGSYKRIVEILADKGIEISDTSVRRILKADWSDNYGIIEIAIQLIKENEEKAETEAKNQLEKIDIALGE